MPRALIVAVVVAILNLAVPAAADRNDPLPSWNDGNARQSILAYVAAVTSPDSPAYVPPAERIATFDNDGTLWSEQPMYFQLLYAIDRVKQLSDEYPAWKQQEPFASILAGDLRGALAGGEHAVLEIIAATHAGMTTEAFDASVAEWLARARHPSTKRAYTDMVYQPMLELLAYLRANGFKTFIVSGGGIDFLRGFAEDTYGIPPEQVVGSSLGARYEVRAGVPVIVKTAEIDFIDDKSGKPIGIHQHIGRRPLFAAGNSDGDLQMLEWTTSGEGRRFGMIIRHTDAEREWSYDRDSHIGRLDAALDAADEQGWLVVDMKKDWKVVYPDSRP